MVSVLDKEVKTIEQDNQSDKKKIYFIELNYKENKKLRIPCVNEQVATRIKASYMALNKN